MPRLAALLAGLLLAVPASAEQGIYGTWAGTYSCNQGRTALVLSIERGKSAPLSARFHFGATADNPSVPSGCFTMHGEHDREQGAFLLRGGAWLARPEGYITVDLEGRYIADPETIRGQVLGPACRGFELRRAPVQEFDEAACRAGAPPLR